MPQTQNEIAARYYQRHRKRILAKLNKQRRAAGLPKRPQWSGLSIKEIGRKEYRKKLKALWTT